MSTNTHPHPHTPTPTHPHTHTQKKTKDKFVIGASASYVAGSVGGSTSHSHGASVSTTVNGHTLTINEMPSHNHNYGVYQYLLKWDGTFTENSHDDGAQPNIATAAAIQNTGGSQPHSHTANSNANIQSSVHLPPYIALCYIQRMFNL